jgi:hypothetical protein
LYFAQELNRPLTFEEFVEQNMPTDKAVFNHLLDNISGKKLIYKIGASLTEVVMAVPHPNQDQTILTITYKVSPGNTEVAEAIDQILSTFQFLD